MEKMGFYTYLKDMSVSAPHFMTSRDILTKVPTVLDNSIGFLPANLADERK